MFAVIDCNNFFVSCERVFQPDLENKPVGVLSNNDGCFVARSNELKALGVPMGAPAFEYRSVIEKHNVVTLSANFHLYADMSRRVMNIIQSAAPQTEIYSVDEAFVDATVIQNPVSVFKELRAIIGQWTGIPVSIGIGKTKTLAKAASEHAKHIPEYEGVSYLSAYDPILKNIPIHDIWGVGRQYGKFLQGYGIQTAYELSQVNDKWLKSQTTVTLQRTVWELRGIPCIRLNEHVEDQKSLVCSRTFGTPVETREKLTHAIAGHVERAAEKLRQQHLVARNLRIYIRTNYHNGNDQQYSASEDRMLIIPTAYTPVLVKAAIDALDTIYKHGYRYKKTGVYFYNIQPDDQIQLNLLDKPINIPKETALMHAVDTVNQKWGRYTLGYASNYRNYTKFYNQSTHTPAYTTSWDELPKIR